MNPSRAASPVNYYIGQPGKTTEEAALSAPILRFLPPIPVGAAAAWLEAQQDHLPPGSLVLDPLGAAPRLPVELALAGYRVIVTANNPVARFLLEIFANLPSRAELNAALADLAAASRGEERLQPHLQSLYRTECMQCQQPVIAEAFIWERGADIPSSRIYTCPACHDQGEYPATEADVQLAQETRLSPMHAARALERVAPLTDPDRVYAQEALAVYPARALYALVTMINKLDSLPPARRRPLEALLLFAFDQANVLWSHPPARTRPRQLARPPRYREKNVWLALEEAVEWWSNQEAAESEIPLTSWPELPPVSGGICLFEGRIKDLVARSSSGSSAAAVVTAIPRPNQAYWTLSSLWAGWLWGSQAVAPFKSVLRRRRYDFAWHTTALYTAFSNLAPELVENALLWALVPECGSESGVEFLSSVILAGALGGLYLTGVALRSSASSPEQETAQISWQSSAADRAEEAPGLFPPGLPLPTLAAQAALHYLRQRNEPASYLHLQAAALQALAQAGRLRPETASCLDTESAAESQQPFKGASTPAELYDRLHNILQEALSQHYGFFRYGRSRSSLESGLWWYAPASTPPRSPGGPTAEGASVEREGVPDPDELLSLSDRVEMEIVRSLIQKPGSARAQLEKQALQAFPGLLAPSVQLITEVILSYGEEQGGDQWHLRPQETPAARRQDLETMRRLMAQLGHQLGCEVISEQPGEAKISAPLTWQISAANSPHSLAAEIHFTASAILSRILFGSPAARRKSLRNPQPGFHRLIVLPGSRARLVEFKLRQDPRLAQAIEPDPEIPAGPPWRFIKFRHVRRLVENPALTLENLADNLLLDPLANRDPQMSLW